MGGGLNHYWRICIVEFETYHRQTEQLIKTELITLTDVSCFFRARIHGCLSLDHFKRSGSFVKNGLKMWFLNKMVPQMRSLVFLYFFAPQPIPNNLIAPVPLTLHTTPIQERHMPSTAAQCVCSSTLRGSLFIWVPASSSKMRDSHCNWILNRWAI